MWGTTNFDLRFLLKLHRLSWIVVITIITASSYQALFTLMHALRRGHWSCKMCNPFFNILSWPKWRIDLELLQFCQFMYIVGYIMCLHCQPLFCYVSLKPLDTFSKHQCPRPTLRISQLLYKITNLWKFRLNRSSESGENNGKTHTLFLHVSPCHDMCLK